jgi:hypothetical protein
MRDALQGPRGANDLNDEKKAASIKGITVALATVGLGGGSFMALSEFGEANRKDRFVDVGEMEKISRWQANDFEYVIQIEGGEEVRIPRWETLAVPARDDSPMEGSIQREVIVSEWPAYLPEILAKQPRETVTGYRYFIVLPDEGG